MALNFKKKSKIIFLHRTLPFNLPHFLLLLIVSKKFCITRVMCVLFYVNIIIIMEWPIKEVCTLSCTNPSVMNYEIYLLLSCQDCRSAQDISHPSGSTAQPNNSDVTIRAEIDFILIIPAVILVNICQNPD